MTRQACVSTPNVAARDFDACPGALLLTVLVVGSPRHQFEEASLAYDYVAVLCHAPPANGDAASLSTVVV